MWIELHQGVHRHRKTVKLARLLGTARMAAVGHMSALWLWALDSAPEGDLSNLDPEDIAVGAEWEGEPETFVDAAVQAEFLDRSRGQLVIHDWHDYAGKLIDRRKADRERKRLRRNTSEETQTLMADVWPDWYSTLYALPGFKVPLEQATKWLQEKGISEDHAETTALAVKSRWPGPAKNPYKDVWATFQNWAKRPPLGGNNATRSEPPSEGDDRYQREAARFGRD